MLTVELFGELIKEGFGGDNKDLSEEKRVKLYSIILRSVTYDFDSLPENFQTKRNILSEKVLFSINKAHLSKSGDRVMEKMRTFVRRHPNSIFLLSSNTDTTGSQNRNIRLARQRANAVKNALIAQAGIPTHRVFSLELATQFLPVITEMKSDEPYNRSVTIQAIDLADI